MSDAPEIAPLIARMPEGERSPGALLDAFLEWTIDLGIELYPAQEEAVLALLEGANVVLNTPTGSGKSLVAIAAHFDALARGERSFYTSPIKALVSEKFFALCQTFGADRVGMLTGDASINARAPVICCTAEVLANMALRQGAEAPVEHVIMDEFHYVSDRDRGMAWQIPLLELERARFLLMSATLGDTRDVEQQLETLTGLDTITVRGAQRPVPLEYEYSERPLLEAIELQIQRSRAPIYVVNFSQREATDLAQSLTSHNLCDSDEKARIADAVGHFRFDSPFGKKVRRYISHGIGLHHAGLLPKYRLLVEQLAQQGLLKVICGTDTLGVGVNVPIRSVLFTKLYKFDGEKRRILSVRDFQQIAGRAGRKGYDDVGYVVCQAPAHVIDNQRLADKVAAGQVAKKKAVKSKPEKGYVPYSDETFHDLAMGPPAALTPVFGVDHGMIMNVLRRPRLVAPHGGYAELIRLIHSSSEKGVGERALKRSAARLFRGLREAGLVYTEPRDDGPGAVVRLGDELQEDFSVFQTLALYLLETLPEIDLDADGAALDIVSLVEAILDNPTPVLRAQLHRARGEAVAEMKAEGIEYSERMDLLDEVTYPKPNAEFIWQSFDEFASHHPWVGAENIKPKSIVREMYEGWYTFGQYVQELGLEASEGVLLRYLSQAYKSLLQSVPEPYHSDELLDVIGYLRAMLGRVDTSLIQAWEKMLEPGDEQVEETPTRARDISRNRRAFTARVRGELHAIVKALAARDWEDAAASVREDPEAMDADAFEAAMAPFYEEYPRLVFDHTARLAERTVMRHTGDHQWDVSQVLVDPEGDMMWVLEGEIDLRADAAPEGPMVHVTRIGT